MHAGGARCLLHSIIRNARIIKFEPWLALTPLRMNSSSQVLIAWFLTKLKTATLRHAPSMTKDLSICVVRCMSPTFSFASDKEGDYSFS